jgi:hypothetical protein
MALGGADTGSGTLPKSPQGDALEQAGAFRAAVAAHEMGHATDFEGRRAPGLRRALERGLWLGGKGSSLLAQARGRPLMAAVGQLAAGAPELYSEGTATFRGLKALKESGKYTPEEMKKMRNTLLWAGGTYLAPRLVDAGFAAGGAALQKYRPDITSHISRQVEESPDAALGLALGYGGAKRLAKILVGAPFGAGFVSSSKKAPPMTPSEAEVLRKQMGVGAQIYEAEPEVIGENAAYMPGGQNYGMFKKPKEEMLGELLAAEEDKGKQKARIKQILTEGGIILPKQKTGAEREEWKKKPPSLGKRIAKGVGLGALTLGTAGGLIAASDPALTKKVVQTVKEHGLKGLKTLKLASAEPPACETLSRAHWPTLAKVLVK